MRARQQPNGIRQPAGRNRRQQEFPRAKRACGWLRRIAQSLSGPHGLFKPNPSAPPALGVRSCSSTGSCLSRPIVWLPRLTLLGSARRKEAHRNMRSRRKILTVGVYLPLRRTGHFRLKTIRLDVLLLNVGQPPKAVKPWASLLILSIGCCEAFRHRAMPTKKEVANQPRLLTTLSARSCRVIDGPYWPGNTSPVLTARNAPWSWPKPGMR